MFVGHFIYLPGQGNKNSQSKYNDGRDVNYITSIMTKQEIGVIVVTVRKQSGPDESRKEKIMATVNFAANGFAYYLHSEHYEALFSKEKEQSLVKMRSCKIRKRRKTV